MDPIEYLNKLCDATDHLNSLWLERCMVNDDGTAAIDCARHDAYDNVTQNIWWFLNGHEDKALAAIESWLKEEDKEDEQNV